MKTPFTRITVKSMVQDEKEIISILAAIREKRLYDDLACLNYYQNFPINYGTDVVVVDKEFVELSVTKAQAIVMADQRTTFLKSDHFRHTVFAMVERVNIEREQAIISRFSYARLQEERRRSIRIDMGGKMTVDFSSRGYTGQAKVYSLSLGGIELHFGDQMSSDRYNKGTVTFTHQGQSLKVPVKPLRTTSDNYEKFYVYTIETSDKSDKFIYRILLQQEKALLGRLREKIVDF